MIERRGAGRPRTHEGGGQRISIYLSREQADYIRAHARENHITVSASIQGLIDACMAGAEPGDRKVVKDDDA